PQSAAVGDFNNDHVMDLAIANRNSNDVSILLGLGDGTFQPGPTIVIPPAGTTMARPQAVVAGGFNGDGKLDFAVANSGTNMVSILLGTGNGNFSSPTNLAVGSAPQFIAVGDFNNDNVPDLAVANQDSNNVSILLGNGNGTFRSATNIAVGRKPRALAV